ncbi:regulator RcnB of Ni and Co efflux [Pseudoxanthomonas sp. GM95]|uniref:RcnB family protein n=1 Tax=Pseudoxanthomonas sp. GM95 TaxID=1881043 RepID=UPI0008BCB11A|nr:RcnB family protein [Pseudoxanthomonas sp. GM95]SEL81649.1 regulator RcnB of Ni and Co efflux [Pseudoxanthomonas sp. GM95]
MKRMSTFVLALTLAASGTAMAAPQHHDDRHDDRRGPPPGHHDDGPHHYARGERLGDGHRGEYVRDYRSHHLAPPPRGHEWRRVDNNYVMVAVATGIITSVIAAGR